MERGRERVERRERREVRGDEGVLVHGRDGGVHEALGANRRLELLGQVLAARGTGAVRGKQANSIREHHQGVVDGVVQRVGELDR